MYVIPSSYDDLLDELDKDCCQYEDILADKPDWSDEEIQRYGDGKLEKIIESLIEQIRFAFERRDEEIKLREGKVSGEEGCGM